MAPPLVMSSNITELEDALAFSRKALEACADYPDLRPFALNALGTVHQSMFIRTGEAGHIDKAIEVLEEAVNLCPPDNPYDMAFRGTLASSLQIRFETSANINDLDRSVVFQEQLLVQAVDHPDRTDRPTVLYLLAMSLYNRYHVTANLADLDRSIVLYEESIELADPPDRPPIAWLLGRSLLLRFCETARMPDLERTVTLLEQALKFPQSTEDRQMGDVADLNRAITFHEEALELCPPTGIHRAESIDLAQSAVESLPPNHPQRTVCLTVLSIAQLRHMDHDDSDYNWSVPSSKSRGYSTLSIDHIVSQLREAVNQPHSPSNDRLLASLYWVYTACDHEACTALFDVLDTAITRHGHSLESRYLQLTTHSGIMDAKECISGAVNYAIDASRSRDAVVFLERGRALLLAQISHSRMPLDIVKEKDTGLAEQLGRVGRQLDRLLVSKTKATDFTTNSVANDVIAQSMRLTSQWDALVEEARKLDGCHEFLRPTPFDALQQAAIGGPIIFINIAKLCSHAIILLHVGDPVIIPLPEATPPRIHMLNNALLDARERQPHTYTLSLRDLWDIIVGPVVDHLKQLVPIRSRIWWCPSASVAELPLHAAGHYYKGADPDKKLPRLFVSSYTSSLGALIHARRATPQYSPLEPRLLVVSQPNTKGQIELNVRDEITFVSGKLSGSKVLEGPDGTPDAVITAIPEHSWIHFSCHAYSVSDNPLKSHFILHEGHLEVLDILRTRNPHAELAVLTACHTAGAGTDAPEEFLHLAGTMQFIGFRSVIGTLWSMEDGDGSFIVKELYRRLFEELDRGNQLAYTCAAEALQDTVWKLRTERKTEPWRWVNYVHYGA
ncbi:hypothetical protein FRB99_005380 [Tulasnella sp. 403]|nr:hypothetical protein FRB99_005380 [Tulasnella sp. 403]